jgi:hypothetical protein
LAESGDLGPHSDKHRGLCLAFEIPEIKGDPGNDESARVNYIKKPLKFPANFRDLPDPVRFELVRKILFTKFDHWKYEKEIRVWAPLQNEEDGVYFLEFDEELQLTEVIIGQKCTISKPAIERALGPLSAQVKISKARAAHDKFAMVKGDDQAL